MTPDNDDSRKYEKGEGESREVTSQHAGLRATASVVIAASIVLPYLHVGEAVGDILQLIVIVVGLGAIVRWALLVKRSGRREKRVQSREVVRHRRIFVASAVSCTVFCMLGGGILAGATVKELSIGMPLIAVFAFGLATFTARSTVVEGRPFDERSVLLAPVMGLLVLAVCLVIRFH